jgi:hypothetical protein
MNWTNDKPTVPGWYRWRNQFGEISVVEVQRRLVPGLRVNLSCSSIAATSYTRGLDTRDRKPCSHGHDWCNMKEQP